MKKLFTLFAAVALTVAASAQTVNESKLGDNWYVGVNAGVASKTTGHALLKSLNPEFGVRVGRLVTPVLGFALEGVAVFQNTDGFSNGTLINSMNLNFLTTANLSNLFGGYKGEPRVFEVSAVHGLGWGHGFGNGCTCATNWNTSKKDMLLNKLGFDFALNLGKAKAWQVYVEPAIVFALNGINNSNDKLQYNINHSALQLTAGVNYKFKNSNGTHNFTIATLRDQAEIDALNANINSLRNDLNGKDADLAAKDKKIAELQNALDECNKKPAYVKPETATNLQPTVLFRQGKSVVDKAQYAPIEMIAQYMKNHPEANIEIKGYASPEGSAELNQKLSEARAAAVKDILVKKYKISADRLTNKGCGATDKLFEQVEFNRVATFNDNTK